MGQVTYNCDERSKDKNESNAPLLLSYLIKSHNVYSTAEIDVLGVKTVDAFLLESFLSKSIVGRQGWRQHWVDNECKDVQTVEKTLSKCALNIISYIIFCVLVLKCFIN